MKKYVISLIAVLLISLDSPAQGFLNSLNKAINGLTQGSLQRNGQRNSSQQTYQNRQGYEQRERLNQQRRGEQQRGYTQQQRSNVNEEYSRTASTVRSEENNTTQSNDKIVTLVVNGTGTTEKEATQNALRSAIEQAFGTFVSANTEVLNDELVKDEIATIASGNISHYNVISTTMNENGLYDVSLQAVVSIGNLTNYTKSKGFQVELAGAEFVMNMKMHELNKKNELAAIEHLKKKLKTIANNGGLFNYELDIIRKKPFIIGESLYGIELELRICENANTKAVFDEIYKTMSILSLSLAEAEDYKQVGLKYYVYNRQLIHTTRGEYALRNYYPNLYEYSGNDNGEISWLMPYIIEGALNIVISDNLGNQIDFSSDTRYLGNCNVWFYSDNPVGNTDERNRYIFYYINPANRIHGINGKNIQCDSRKRIEIGIPLTNSGANTPRMSKLVLNPFQENNENHVLGRQRLHPTSSVNNINKCYYKLNFVVEYSEEEMSKLENFYVKVRNSSCDNTGKTISSDKDYLRSNKLEQMYENNIPNLNEKIAEFPGGSGAMMQYISRNIKYPVVAAENGIQGNVIIQFYVEKDGSITNPTVSKSVDPSLDKEALRMVRSMPKWNPAQKNGEAVRSQQTITIPFRL